MPDQDPAPENQDTPETSEAVEDNTADAPVDIPEGYIPEDRYKEAQAWGTKASQEAAEWRELVTRAQAGDKEALEFLGYESADTEEETDEPEYTTEEDRIARLEQQLAERQTAEEEQAQMAQLEEAASRFYDVEFNRLDPKKEWTDEYKQLVAAVGDEFLDEDGLPQLDKAHEALEAHAEAEFKKRVEAKRRPQAPTGASPSHEPDMDDDETRRAYLAQRYAEVQQDF